MSTQEKETLFEFPCTFPLKIMGLSSNNFKEDMLNLAKKHIPNLSEANITSKPSKSGKYTSLTITFTAQSKLQLDNLYRAFNAQPQVKMVL